MAALFSRRQARDLFDSHQILRMDEIDSHRLRTGFVVYGAMNRKDWRTVSADGVEFDATELARQLIPTLRVNTPELHVESAKYGTRMVKECQDNLSAVLPFSGAELEFLDLLLERGKIDATLLTSDKDLQKRIQNQPLLKWKAINVRRHKGLY